jgi:hypothetical protein
MSRARRRLPYAVCQAALLLSISLAVSAQEPSLATKQLEDVRLRGDGLASLLADISLQYDIPIGFESAMNGSGVRETRIRKANVTLTDLLTQLMAEHSEYSWEINDAVVHVFPKEGRRDPIIERLLNVEIRKFSLGKGTLTWDVETTLLKTPEFKEVVDAYGLGTLGWNFSGFYFPNFGKNYTLDVSDTSVRSILDRIVKESPTAKFWSIRRDSREHTFSIGFSALAEGAPKNFVRVDLEELERLGYPTP